MSKANPRFRRINAPLPNLTTNMVRATFIYLCDNQICLWNLDFIGTTTSYSGAGFEGAMAASIKTALNTNLLAVLAADCTWTQLKIQSLTQPTRQPGFAVVGGFTSPGSVAGNHIPLEMGVILFKTTAIKGQHGRGRATLPGIPSSFLTPATDPNRINATGSTALQTLVTQIASLSYTDGGNVYTFGLSTRVLHGAPVVQGIGLAGIGARLLLGTVRRRRIGRGK